MYVLKKRLLCLKWNTLASNLLLLNNTEVPIIFKLLFA